MNKYVYKKKINIILAATLDFFGYIFFEKSIRPSKQFDKILVVRLDQLGDIVATIPVYSQLKKANNGAKIYALTTEEGKEILKHSPFIEDIITFQCPWHSNEKFNLKQILSVKKQIQEKQFDCAIELKGDIRNIFFLKACGVTNITSYGITGGSFLLVDDVPFDKSLNAVNRNIALLKTIVLNPSYDEKPVIYLNKDEKECSFAEDTFKTGKIVIAFHTSAGTSAKIWSQQKYISLIKKCRDALKTTCILVGKEASPDIEKVADFSFLGKTTIRQLIYLLKKVKLLVTNDSGPAHIAAALGIPVIVIWGGTSNPETWKPIGENVRVLHKNVFCEFCEKRKCENPICLDHISVEDAFEFIKKQL